MFQKYHWYLRFKYISIAVVLVSLGVAAVPRQASADSGEYTVQSGDTLSALAQRYGVSVSDIARVNGLSDINYIRVGQSLFIPNPLANVQGGGSPLADTGFFFVDPSRATVAAPASVLDSSPASAAPLNGDGLFHQVVRGDTLWDIAVQYGVDVSDIQAANNLRNPRLLSTGQVLLIPAASEPAPAVRSTARRLPSAPAPETAALAGLPEVSDDTWQAADFSGAPTYRLSHYCLYGNMATGRYVYPGAVAADRSMLPFGTRLLIEGLAGIFTVEDRFGADAGELRLDLWVPDCGDAIKRGIQYRRVMRVAQ